jgi:hypothetical protein
MPFDFPNMGAMPAQPESPWGRCYSNTALAIGLSPITLRRRLIGNLGPEHAELTLRDVVTSMRPRLDCRWDG